MSSTPTATDYESYARRLAEGWTLDVGSGPCRWGKPGEVSEVAIPAHVTIHHDHMSVDDYLADGWKPEPGPGFAGSSALWVIYEPVGAPAGTRITWPMPPEHVAELARRQVDGFGLDVEQCRWPADGHAPSEREGDWDACGRSASREVSNGPAVRWLVRLPVCSIHEHDAYRAGWHALGHRDALSEGGRPWMGRASEATVTGGPGLIGAATAQDWMRTAADVLDADRSDNPLHREADHAIARQLRWHAEAIDAMADLDRLDATRRQRQPGRALARWAAAIPLRQVEGLGIALSEWAGRHLDRMRR